METVRRGRFGKMACMCVAGGGIRCYTENDLIIFLSFGPCSSIRMLIYARLAVRAGHKTQSLVASLGRSRVVNVNKWASGIARPMAGVWGARKEP